MKNEACLETHAQMLPFLTGSLESNADPKTTDSVKIIFEVA